LVVQLVQAWALQRLGGQPLLQLLRPQPLLGLRSSQLCQQGHLVPVQELAQRLVPELALELAQRLVLEPGDPRLG
jgi:hypothetical protein